MLTQIGRDLSKVTLAKFFTVMLLTAPIIQNGIRYNSSFIQIGYGPHCLTTREAIILCQLMSGTDPITFSWSLPNGTIIAGGKNLVVSLPGKYSCNVQNRFGRDSASSEVIGKDYMHIKIWAAHFIHYH